MNQSTALNWTVLLLSMALTLCTLIIDDSVLILNLGLSTTAMSALKLVAYLFAPVLAAYNGYQINQKSKNN